MRKNLIALILSTPILISCASQTYYPKNNNSEKETCQEHIIPIVNPINVFIGYYSYKMCRAGHIEYCGRAAQEGIVVYSQLLESPRISTCENELTPLETSQ